MALPGAGNLQDDNSSGDNSAASERLGQSVSEPRGRPILCSKHTRRQVRFSRSSIVRMRGGKSVSSLLESFGRRTLANRRRRAGRALVFARSVYFGEHGITVNEETKNSCAAELLSCAGINDRTRSDASGSQGRADGEGR